MHFAPAHLTGARLTSGQPAVPDSQLELGLPAVSAARSVGQLRNRRSRASWWFQRMRQIVNRACDWQSVPTPRPEQTSLTGTHRTITLAPQSGGDQQQICE